MKQNHHRILALLLVLLLFPIAMTTGVSANAGPPHSLVDGDADFLLPIKHTDIEVVSESLDYQIAAPRGEEMQAEIAARYTMRNTASDQVTVLAAFVSNNPALTPEIAFRGQPVTILKTEKLDWESYPIEPGYKDNPVVRDWYNLSAWTQFGLWEPTFEEIMFYFSTGEISADFDPSGNYFLEVTLFEMTFAPGESCRLEVSYTEKAAYITDAKGYTRDLNPRFEFYYFLEPAQYWKDFRDLTVTVAAPPEVTLQMSLEGFTKENGVHSAHFNALPEQNLQILVHLPFTHDNSAIWIGLGGSLLMVLLTVGLAKWTTKGRR